MKNQLQPSGRNSCYTPVQRKFLKPLNAEYGRKWKVNDEMKPLYRKGEEWLYSEPTDYKTIAEQNQRPNSQLIRKKWTGKSLIG